MLSLSADGMLLFTSAFGLLLLAEYSVQLIAANSDPSSASGGTPLNSSLSNMTQLETPNVTIPKNTTETPAAQGSNASATHNTSNKTLVNNPLQIVILLWQQENSLFDGDIAGVTYTGEEPRFGIRYSIRPWPDRKIPYTLDPSYSTEEVNKIKNAMEMVMNDTCLKFTPRNNERYYLRISNTGDGCYSYVGNRETVGGQILSLESSPTKTCIDQKVILHELLHAAGLWHEHSRGNRKTLMVHLHSAKPRKRIYFTKLDPEFDPFNHLSYDQYSIMHFPMSAWAKERGQATLLSTNPMAGTWMGNGRFLSLDDRYKIKWLYGCLHRQNGGQGSTTRRLPLRRPNGKSI